MTEPDRIAGFDAAAAADDVSLVVMDRAPDGRWRVHNVEGPDHPLLQRVVARITAAPPEPPDWLKQPVDWPAQVESWMRQHAGTLTGEQQEVLRRTFGPLLRDGKIALTP